jgi:Zn-dependent alcohol dehydrogenase
VTGIVAALGLIAVGFIAAPRFIERAQHQTDQLRNAFTGGGRDAQHLATARSQFGFDIGQAAAMGVVTVVGIAPVGAEAGINAVDIVRNEKTMRGTYYGSTHSSVEMPKLVDMYLAGKLNLDDLVVRHYSLDQINEACDDLESGFVRGVDGPALPLNGQIEFGIPSARGHSHIDHA